MKELITEEEIIETNIKTNIVYIEKPIEKKVYTKKEIIVEISKEISNTEGITVSEASDGIVLNMHEILFDFNKSIIKEDMKSNLDLIVDMINKYSIMYIIIIGHTDNVGKEPFNLELSEKRAKAVNDYFVYKGIPQDKISYIGYGSSRPIADNKIEEGRAKNRRVEIKLVTK